MEWSVAPEVTELGEVIEMEPRRSLTRRLVFPWAWALLVCGLGPTAPGGTPRKTVAHVLLAEGGRGRLACGPLVLAPGLVDGTAFLDLRYGAKGGPVASEIQPVWWWEDGSVRLARLVARLPSDWAGESLDLTRSRVGASRGGRRGAPSGSRASRGEAFGLTRPRTPAGRPVGWVSRSRTGADRKNGNTASGRRSEPAPRELWRLENGSLKATLGSAKDWAVFREVRRGGGRLRIGRVAPVLRETVEGEAKRAARVPREKTAGGRPRRSGVERPSLELVRAGSLSLTVALRGRLDAGEGGPQLMETCYLTFVRESAEVDLTLFVVAVESGLTEGLDLELVTGLRAPVRAGIEGVVADREIDAGASLEVWSKPYKGRMFTDRGGSEVAAPCAGSSRHELRLEVSDGKKRLSVVIDRFDELAPRRLTVSANGTVTVGLFDGPLAWEPGSALRLDAVLGLGVPAGDLRPPAWAERGLLRVVAAAGAPQAAGEERNRWRGGLLAAPLLADPWVGGWIALEPSQGVIRAVEGAAACLERAVDPLRGALDHGDYRTGWGAFANLEFDPAFGLLLEAIRGSLGRRRAVGLSEVMLRHWTTHDIVRTPGRDRGLAWMHGWEHRSERVELGHVFVQGAMLAEAFLPDPLLAEVVQGIGSALVREARSERVSINERSVGWSLTNLVALAGCEGRQRGQAPIQRNLDELQALLARHRSGTGAFVFDRDREAGSVLPETGESLAGARFSNTWVTCCTTIEGLRDLFRLTGGAPERLWLEGAARWVAGLVRRRPRLEIPRRITWPALEGDGPTAAGRLDVTGSLIVAAALGRSARELDDPALGELARAITEDVIPRAAVCDDATAACKRLRALAGL